MTTPRKRRTRAHVIADLGVNHVERVLFRAGCSVTRNAGADYGCDLIVWTHDADGGVEAGTIKVQVKATDRLPMLADGETISFRAETADAALWRGEQKPFVLVVYDASADRAHWLDVWAWASGRRWTAADWRTRSVRVRLPLASRFTVPAVRRLRERKNALLAG